jgi:hypothetical protein
VGFGAVVLFSLASLVLSTFIDYSQISPNDIGADQQKFAGIMNKYKNLSKGEKNPLKMDEFHIERNRELCALRLNNGISNWIGEISDIDKSISGAHLSVKIPGDTELKTKRSTLLDLSGSESTVIRENSKIFGRIKNLKIGDIVLFSGKFVANNNECVNEISHTKTGGLSRPELIFKFLKLIKNID